MGQAVLVILLFEHLNLFRISCFGFRIYFQHRGAEYSAVRMGLELLRGSNR